MTDQDIFALFLVIAVFFSFLPRDYRRRGSRGR